MSRIAIAGSFDTKAAPLAVLIDQLRAIDNRRLVRGPLARVGRRLMTRVGEALLEVLDLAEA